MTPADAPLSALAPAQALLGQFRWLGRVLRGRAQRQSAWAQAPDWIDPACVESLSLALAGPRGAPTAWVLDVALRDGHGARDLPRSLALGGAHPPLPLRPLRAARARAQSLSVLRRDAPCILGTATCLARDRLHADRQYLVTCGHVAAPDARARVNQEAAIDGGQHAGYLCEWQPSLGRDGLRSAIDAALLEVTAGTVERLGQSGLLPAGVSDDVRLNLPVRVRRHHSGDLAGELRIHWTGQVDLEATPGDYDYVLTDAIGYAATQPTQAGDSGAALWTDRDELLIGMHLAGLPEGGAGGANAVMGRTRPVFDWFAVEPLLRPGAGVPPLASPFASGRAPQIEVQAIDGFDRDTEVVAKTLWGEARGESEEGMRAVAGVICNRIGKRQGWVKASDVCLARYQFSCWLEGDPNRRQLDAVQQAPDAKYRLARVIAAEVVGHVLRDTSNGATHYYATSLATPPWWARGKTPCRTLGGHRFFNDID